MDKPKKDIGAYEYFKEQHGQNRDFVDKLMDTPVPTAEVPDDLPPDPYPQEAVKHPATGVDPDSATSSPDSPSHSGREFASSASDACRNR